MNKVAIIVPIYQPHYKFAQDLIESFYQCELNLQADMWFVFTNIKERDNFSSKYDYRSIVIPSNWNVDRGIINRKKFFSIKSLYQFYKYMLVCDSESYFVKNVDLINLFDKYFADSLLLGNKTTYNASWILNRCLSHFDPNFAKVTSNLYCWFNQLCIYNSSHIKSSFDIIKYDQLIDKIEYGDFDYYIYMYYLMIYHGFTVHDTGITSVVGAFEGYLDPAKFSFPEWIKSKIYGASFRNQYMADYPNFFMFFHKNR